MMLDSLSSLATLSITLVILVSYCLCFFLYRDVRKARFATLPRQAKQFPIKSKDIRDIIIDVQDKGGVTHRFGSSLDTYFVLLISSHCEACERLFDFLSLNKAEMERFSPVFILTKSVPGEIKRRLWPAAYPIIDDEKFWSFFDGSTIPMLYSVKDNRLQGRYLVNAGEDILSIVAPGSLSELVSDRA